jgi:hypothetical protein
LKFLITKEIILIKSMQILKSSRIYIPVTALIVCLIARWIFVIGYGDFGTDFDYVSRLFQGQRQGRDFFAIFPPLSGDSLLLFSKVIGQNYFTINVHLWFWWIANTIVAAGIMRALNNNKEMVALVAVSVALLTIPPNMHGVSFAYIASTLCGLSVLCLLKYNRTQNAVVAIVAGLAGGVAIAAKPNVGVAIIGAIVLTCIGVGVLQRQAYTKYLKCGSFVLGGALCGVLAAVAIPGWYGGFEELWRQVFLGGSEIKGGGLWLILRTIPRISLTLEPPFRWMVELFLTIPLFVLSAVFFARLALKTVNKPLHRNSAKFSFAERYLWALFAFIFVLSVWSLWPHDFPWRLTTLFSELGFTSLPFLLWQILYIVVFVALIVAIAGGILRNELLEDLSAPVWVSVISLIWMLGIVASGRHNIVFAATIFVPALVFQYANGREKAFYKVTISLLAVWTLAWHVAPNWKSTFGQLTPLPADSKLAGLYWPDGGAQTPGSYPMWNSSETIMELSKNITPRVKDKSVLWLIPGPGPVFGGDIYSYGIHGLSANNVPQWGEKKFGIGVRLNPPDYIVSSALEEWEEWDDEKWSFMRPDIIEPWIRENYDLVWTSKSSVAPIYLWAKMPSDVEAP